MRIIIHGGLHKTGTTAFQVAMSQARDLLLSHGILFPPVADGAGHHAWANRATHGDLGFVPDVLFEARRSVGPDGTVLLSSEDFENLLADAPAAAALEQRIFELGGSQVTWAFCIRDPYEYLLSLYAEMCKHGVVLDIDLTADVVIRTGRLRVSNGSTDWTFVFDYPESIARFRTVARGEVSVTHFADEIAAFPGSGVLRLAGASDALMADVAGDASLWIRSARNERLEPLEVERRYTSNFLGRAATSGIVDTHWIEQTARVRHEAVLAALPAIEARMHARFDGYTRVLASESLPVAHRSI